MELQKELKSLKTLLGTDGEAFDKKLEFINTNFKSDADREVIDNFVKNELVALTNDLQKFNADLDVKIKLAEVSQIVSMSYIAKKYFNKSRYWLHQRINGNIVNGKSAKFTDDEKNILNNALKDVAQKIGSVSV